MCARYLHATEGQYSYGVEGTPYSRAADSTQYFGLALSEVTFPNPNPHMPHATGGERRGPHVLSPEPKEYQFEIEYAILDHNVPFQNALGKVTTTAKDPDGSAASGDEYDEHLFEEARTLPTITVEHAQKDAGSDLLQEFYVGAKSNLTLSFTQGDMVRARQAFSAPVKEDDNDALSIPSLGTPQDQVPYRFFHHTDAQIDRTSDGSAVSTIKTLTSGDLTWDNGLSFNQHGNGREAYSISEDQAADKYDMTIGLLITDLTEYNEARDDNALVDIDIPFHRPPGQSSLTDAMIVTLKECKLASVPVPKTTEGPVEATVEVQPRDTQIEIRTPT